MAQLKPKEKVRKPKMYTAAEAADIVGLAPSTVRGYCNAGKVGKPRMMPGVDIKVYFLSEADLVWLKNEANRPKGRPPKQE